ncbi:MAG: sugar phosphate isomerase/epimerase family protein [Thermoguttaceae bacterium]
MFLGYNTNGLAHHDLFDAVDLLAAIGYRGIAITVDHGVLSPRDPSWEDQLERLARRLAERGMRSVIETGARFLLDPRRKHAPTLVSAQADRRRRRVDFYRHCIDCAGRLGSDCVSIWSGVLHEPAGPDEVFARLAAGLDETLRYAAGQGVVIALEPEPGMFIDSQRRMAELLQRFPSDSLRLTIDVGHLHCQGEVPIAREIAAWQSRLANVHLDDAVAGRHEHLLFGQGQIEFAPVIEALHGAGYRRGLYVELSRHSHVAPEAARTAFEFLQPLLQKPPHQNLWVNSGSGRAPRL